MSVADDALERALRRLGDDPWNAFVSVDAEGARARARRAEGPLAGLVLSVKDNLAVRGQRMTCASRFLADYVAPYTATAVARAEAAGAVVLGKTNMDEFACGSSGESSAFGPTRNPADLERVPGGSSSGAGASVAAGVVDVAMGSDTGGSVRAPGSFCGVAALKPSPGALSRHGLADLAMSLESPAPMAASVDLVRRLLLATAGADPFDPSTRAFAFAPDDGRPLRVGIVREFVEAAEPDVAARVRDAAAALRDAGHVVEDASMPGAGDGLATYYLINYAEFSSAMQRYDGTRYGPRGARGAEDARACLGPEVKRRILLGTYVTSREGRGRWYARALRSRARIASAFARAFRDHDVLVGPTMPFRAFRLGERVSDPRALYAADVLTVNANLAGVPAGTVPLRVPGLPVGLQVLGPAAHDLRVLRVMEDVERLSGVRA
jgi:aspartyl-tRNA(Asn)/glutamyl-tRNA(Gln) amidotransferase subunit A